MKKSTSDQLISIKAFDIREAQFLIVGTAPLVIHNFSQKSRLKMRDTMEQDQTAKKKKVREARGYAQEFNDAKHFSGAGWEGFAAPGLRRALIDACRTAGMVMTQAKMTVFVHADGFDKIDGMPLVRIFGAARHVEHMVRLESGVADLRVRPMYDEWYAVARLQYDAGQIAVEDVANLLARAGAQVGLGEGRPFSRIRRAWVGEHSGLGRMRTGNGLVWCKAGSGMAGRARLGAVWQGKAGRARCGRAGRVRDNLLYAPEVIL